MPTAIPGQIISGSGTSVWPNNGQINSVNNRDSSSTTQKLASSQTEKILKISENFDYSRYKRSSNGKILNIDDLCQPYSLTTEWLVWVLWWKWLCRN